MRPGGRMQDIVLGDRELDVMGVLWDAGSGTVTEVRDRLPAELAYTTVLTILRNLEEKGLVAHEVEGRAHRYTPRVARRAARSTLLGRLLDKMFQGSAEQLLVHLVRDRHLSSDDLARIRAQLEEPADPDADGPAKSRARKGKQGKRGGSR